MVELNDVEFARWTRIEDPCDIERTVAEWTLRKRRGGVDLSRRKRVVPRKAILEVQSAQAVTKPVGRGGHVPAGDCSPQRNLVHSFKLTLPKGADVESRGERSWNSKR